MEENNEIYILQKDLPSAKAGAELTKQDLSGWYHLYGYRNEVTRYSQYDVENTPEWFKKKEYPKYTESDIRKFAENCWNTFGSLTKETFYHNLENWLNPTPNNK